MKKCKVCGKEWIGVWQPCDDCFRKTLKTDAERHLSDGGPMLTRNKKEPRLTKDA